MFVATFRSAEHLHVPEGPAEDAARRHLLHPRSPVRHREADDLHRVRRLQRTRERRRRRQAFQQVDADSL